MNRHSFRFLGTSITVAACALATLPSLYAAQGARGAGASDWITFAANSDEAGYRRTDFFYPRYNTAIFDWDSRLEFWLPPFRSKFSWGFYARLAGIAGLKDLQSLEAKGLQGYSFPNALLAGPGVGFQVYPLSSRRFQTPKSSAGKVFGPLRLYAEYNRTDYWGNENSWRPHDQSRIGFDYWKAVSVNNPDDRWWLEIWNGLYWQSSNEFTATYDSLIFANAWRAGIRKPRAGAISTITPYLAVESSRSKFNRPASQACFTPVPTSTYPLNPNPCNFYWENGLWAGGGLRYAPSLTNPSRKWLERFVVYAEYLNTAAYYGPTAPSPVPRFDVRVGVSASVGQWYKQNIP